MIIIPLTLTCTDTHYQLITAVRCVVSRQNIDRQHKYKKVDQSCVEIAS